MKKIGVKMSIAGRDVPVKSLIRSKHDADGNLIVTFKVGARGQDEVKLIFDKREYLDIKDE